MRAFPHEKDVEKSKRLKDKFILNCRDQRLTLWVRDKDGYRQFTYTDVLTKAQDHEGNVQATALAYEGRRGGKQIQEMSLDVVTPEVDNPADIPSTQEYLGNLTDKSIHQMSALLHRTTPFALKKPGVGSAKPGACFHCGESGHLIRNCTTFQNAVQRIRRNPEQYGFALAMSQTSSPQWNNNSYHPRGRGNSQHRGYRGNRGGRGRGRGNRGKGGNPRIQEITEVTEPPSQPEVEEEDGFYYDDTSDFPSGN